MNYLFFDIECANPRFNSICTFGYYLVDEQYTVIEHDDILINPETSYDPYVIKHILHYTTEELEAHMPFPCYHDRLRALMQTKETLVFGFSISNDIRFLNETCLRYRLPCLNFRFYDIQKIFGAYVKATNQASIELAGEQLHLEKPAFVHRSDEDARITMEIARALCQELKMPLLQLVDYFPGCGGSNIDFSETWLTEGGTSVIDHRQNRKKRLKLREKRLREQKERKEKAKAQSLDGIKDAAIGVGESSEISSSTELSVAGVEFAVD